MKPFTFSKPYLLSHKYTLAAYVIIILATTAISIISPYLIGDFLDILIEGADIGVILRFCIIFGGLSIIRILIGYITTIMYTKMQAKMSYDLNMDAIKHVQGLSLSYINKKDSAYLSQRLGTDTYNLIAFCISMLQSIITNVIMLIVPFMILLAMNWLIAVLMVAFLIAYTTLYFAFKKPLYNAGFAFREAQAKYFSKLLEQLKYIKIIKINSIQPQMNMRAESSFMDFKGKVIHNQKINYLYSGLDGFISAIAQIALFVIGGIQILAGNFTIGMFTIFTSYFGMMLGASRYFFGLGASYQNVLVSYNRIKEVFDQKQESCGEKIIRDVSKIEVRDVSFSYDTYDESSVEDDSDSQKLFHHSDSAKHVHNCNSLGSFRDSNDPKPFHAKRAINSFGAEFLKGKMYAIAGANGVGKSTLISLMLGMYIDEYEGSITYNGIDIRSIDMVATRRNLIGFAEQEPLLINDTIRYNLNFVDVCNGECISRQNQHSDSRSRKLDINDTDYYNELALDCDSLVECTKILNMKDFIHQNTMDFEINESNTNTSGGEKQKIAILKVLCKNSAVMIFDEPTSALDAETAKQFLEHLHRLKQDKIIILITHDETAKIYCDEVVIIQK